MMVDHRRGAILPLPEGTSRRVLTVSIRIVAVALLAVIGVIHLVETPDHFAAAQYLGVLFVLATVGSWLAAAGVAAGLRGAWILGALVAAGAFAGLVVAATAGLPGYRETLSAPWAVPSLIAESAYLLAYCAAAVARHDPTAL